MVSFTLTEKAYPLRDNDKNLYPDVAADMENGPSKAVSLLGRITALCLHRMHTCDQPIALVSMDNCQHNSLRLRWSMLEIAYAWKAAGLIDEAELSYLSEQITFPVTMIDKITPHPDPEIAKLLKEDGLDNMMPSKPRKAQSQPPSSTRNSRSICCSKTISQWVIPRSSSSASSLPARTSYPKPHA